MKKYIALLALALAVTLNPAHAQSQQSTPTGTFAPAPSLPRTAKITEAQFDAIVAAQPALVAGKQASDVAAFAIFGGVLHRTYATVNGDALSETVAVTPSQLASIVAAGPPLPSGESASTVKSYAAQRLTYTNPATHTVVANVIQLTAQFSQ
jgi:hypothetical protein